MVRLGMWQLERMEEKSLRLASIAQKKHDGPLSLAALNTLNPDLQDYPVTVNGRVRPDYIVYLDNRIENGRVGYQVLAAVITDAGQVLVNFGWVPATSSRQHLPAVTLPAQLTNAEGIIRIPADNPVIRETATRLKDGQLLLQQIDIAHLKQVTKQAFLPFVVQLQTPEDAQFVRNWQPVVMSPEKHLGYAIQWFGLAIAAAVIACVVFFSRGNAHVQTKQK
ncbi:SURF1 family protein [Salinimonas marina]|uniref:SURF1-like protein n=2 Tax=Salinimonas marina TaxID=2785918 RepID=A0A7S9HEI1_9ALTE|nr:SURF1 family protein [Salinimonas marina]